MPYMIDPNKNKEMFESDDIIKYLFETYGPGSMNLTGEGQGNNIPLGLRLGILTTISCALALMPRMAKGSTYIGSKFTSASKNDSPGDSEGIPSTTELSPLTLWGTNTKRISI